MKNTFFTRENNAKMNYIIKAGVDEYCTEEGCIVHFDEMLYLHLTRVCGFEYILFYSNNKGLYFYDEKSLNYYLGNQETTETEQMTDEDLSDAFSNRDYAKVDENEVQKANTRENKYVYPEIKFCNAFDTIEYFVNDLSRKCAVIIKDTVSFLELIENNKPGKDESRSYQSRLRGWNISLLDRRINNNIIIWLALKSDDLSKFNYFKDDTICDNQTNKINKNRVTEIEMKNISIYEIRNAINNYRITNRGFKVDFSDYDKLLAMISEKIMRYDLSIRYLFDIFDYIKENKYILNSVNFDVALKWKLKELSLKVATDVSYKELLEDKRFSYPPSVLDYIHQVEDLIESSGISLSNVMKNKDRLSPVGESEFARLLKTNPEKYNLHIALVGPPGTGKTTFAKLIGKMYRELGILPSEKFVKATRGDLVGAYVGETAIKTRAKIDEAMGGTLFIDEAYSLNGEGNDFGQEAISTIVEAMTDRMGQFAVIIAGYKNQTMKLIASNEGLQSRFQKIIEITDYEPSKYLAKVKSILEQEQDKFILDENFENNFEGFIVALKDYYWKIASKTGQQTSWASMRTIIGLTNNLITACRRAYKYDNRELDSNGNMIIMSVDLGPDEEYVYNEYLRSISTFDNKNKDIKKEEFLNLELLETNQKMNIINRFVELQQSVDTNTSEKIREQILDIIQASIVHLKDEEGRMSGTGFFIDDSGYLLTCNHVSKVVHVGQFFEKNARGVAKVDVKVHEVMTSQIYDIALMKADICNRKVTYCNLAVDYNKHVERNTFVCMLGFPFGLETKDGPSYNDGKTTGVCEESLSINDVIFTKEFINLQMEGKSGNSGSPIFDSKFNVIGVFQGSRTEGERLIEEINRAVPIKYAYNEFILKNEVKK